MQIQGYELRHQAPQRKSHGHIAQTLSVAELSEHQCKKLLPADEMLDIMVHVILVNKMTKFVIVLFASVLY